jgi:hypothetical protein|tara:strand:+ start:1042 stop:1203 length:162 start_codon:yes stop_codon:yes gene_type:complete
MTALQDAEQAHWDAWVALNSEAIPDGMTLNDLQIAYRTAMIVYNTAREAAKAG